MKFDGGTLTDKNHIVLKSTELADAIASLITDYVDENAAEIYAIMVEAGKEGVEILRKNSLVHGKDYADDWKVKERRVFKRASTNKKHSGSLVLHLPNHYRVSHLLEKGAIRARTGIMPGDGHIAKSFEEIKENLNIKLGGN